MGCHTWCYSKIEDITDFDKYFIKSPYSEFSNDEIFCVYMDVKDEYYEKVNYNWDDLPSEIKKYYHSDNGLIVKHKGNYYSELPFSDIFRIGGYPEDVVLTSYDDCVKFIMSDNVVEHGMKTEEITDSEGYVTKYEYHDKGVYPLDYAGEGQTKESVLKVCKDFFEKYSNGLIQFG